MTSSLKLDCQKVPPFCIHEQFLYRGPTVLRDVPCAIICFVLFCFKCCILLNKSVITCKAVKYPQCRHVADRKDESKM